MNYKKTSQPYFYIIQDKTSKKYYAGVKTVNADPVKLLCKDGYLTSSKIIKHLLLENGLETFSIRRIKLFSVAKNAEKYEVRFLKRVNARANPTFFNMHNGDGNFTTLGLTMTLETRAKMSAASKGKQKSSEHRKNMTRANRLKANDPAIIKKLQKSRGPMSDETKEKLRIIALKRPPMSKEQKEKISKSLTGRIVSKEAREKSSLTQKGRPCLNKGKTYEELYGAKKAAELKELRRLSGKKNKGRQSKQKGKTYEEMYGLKKAKELKQKVKRRAA